MTDDPREILKAAGVECVEVATFREAADRWEVDSHDHGDESVNAADAAIVALARIVAKDRGMLRLAWDDLDDDFPDEVSEGDFEGYVADLDRRWSEHNA